MRISVEHTETFTYETPSMGTIQVLRLTPRDYTGHYVCDWSVDVDAECKITRTNDAFGNVVTSFSVAGPLESLTFSASGEVETEETHGVIRGSAETVPTGVFLRPTQGVNQNAMVRTLLAAAGEASGTPLDQMHALMAALHMAIPRPKASKHGKAAASVGPTPSQGQNQSNSKQAQDHQQEQYQKDASAKEPSSQGNALAKARLKTMLVEQENLSAGTIAMLFCDVARHLDLPARLVSGYRLGDETKAEKTARDVWAEVLIDRLGWVGFDPMDKTCPSDDSVRVAIGLDTNAVNPVRIAHYGGLADLERTTRIVVQRIDG